MDIIFLAKCDEVLQCLYKYGWKDFSRYSLQLPGCVRVKISGNGQELCAGQQNIVDMFRRQTLENFVVVVSVECGRK